MFGGLPASTWVLMLASQSASPVNVMSMLLASPNASSAALMAITDGSSRSEPVIVTSAPSKSWVPPAGRRLAVGGVALGLRRPSPPRCALGRRRSPAASVASVAASVDARRSLPAGACRRRVVVVVAAARRRDERERDRHGGQSQPASSSLVSPCSCPRSPRRHASRRPAMPTVAHAAAGRLDHPLSSGRQPSRRPRRRSRRADAGGRTRAAPHDAHRLLDAHVARPATDRQRAGGRARRRRGSAAGTPRPGRSARRRARPPSWRPPAARRPRRTRTAPGRPRRRRACPTRGGQGERGRRRGPRR